MCLVPVLSSKFGFGPYAFFVWQGPIPNKKKAQGPKPKLG